MNSVIELPATEVSISVSAHTDIGMVRRDNEDAFLLADLTTGECGLDLNRGKRLVGIKGTLLAVADGMGGAAAGEVASQMAIESLCRTMLQLPWGLPADNRLAEATERANDEILNRSHSDGLLAGMGTTLTAALVQGNSAEILQIGDSRAYLIRDDEVYQLTKDQTLAQMLLDNGILTPSQAATYPRNVIFQALGQESHLDPVITHIKLRAGDYLLLCSDGLSNKVKDEEMREAIQSSTDLAVACRRLIEMANERGGEDNITVVIARME